MSKIESHECLSRHKDSLQDGGIGLSSGMGLYVRVFCTEQFLDTCNGKTLGLINDLAAAVVPFSGIAFGILVRKA